MGIVSQKPTPVVDLSDQSLVQRATVDLVEVLLDAIRPLPAREALKVLTDLTEVLRGRQP